MATVLYVDDEEMIGIVVTRFFALRGDTVHHAKSLAAAKEFLSANNPAIIFLDVWLGMESGVDLMTWLVDNKPELADRVTFVTGEPEGASTANRWAGFERPVIRKPFDLESLADAKDAAEKRRGM